MTEFTETAEAIRAEETNAAASKPFEWWGVIGQHEERPQTCESREVAEATRIFYDSRYPALAPHRVLRLVEQPV